MPPILHYTANQLSLTQEKEQLLIFRDIVKQCSPHLVKSVQDVCQLAITHEVALPVVSNLVKRLLMAPVSTVDVERGFSRVSLLKTELRNSLNQTSMQNLLMIALEGPTEEKFNFNDAFITWAKMSERRLL